MYPEPLDSFLPPDIKEVRAQRTRRTKRQPAPGPAHASQLWCRPSSPPFCRGQEEPAQFAQCTNGRAGTFKRAIASAVYTAHVWQGWHLQAGLNQCRACARVAGLASSGREGGQRSHSAGRQALLLSGTSGTALLTGSMQNGMLKQSCRTCANFSCTLPTTTSTTHHHLLAPPTHAHPTSLPAGAVGAGVRTCGHGGGCTRHLPRHDGAWHPAAGMLGLRRPRPC